MPDSSASTINERAAEEWFDRAVKAERTGDTVKTVELYERALNEDPDHEQAAFNLAVLYDRRADDAKAIDLYERLCTGQPVHLNALMNLAVLYEDNGFYEEARRCLRAVVNTDPHHARARLFLKDVESAREMSEEEEERRADRRQTVLDTPVTEFELSVRSRNALKKMNIRNLGDLLKVSEQELMGFKNFGETSLNEIKSLLAAKGYRLGQAADGGGASILASLPLEEDEAPAPEEVVAPGDEIATEVLDRKVGDLELSVRSRKALQRLNLVTVGDLAVKTEDELLGCKNFGMTSLNEIKQVLGSLGLHLRRLAD